MAAGQRHPFVNQSRLHLQANAIGRQGNFGSMNLIFQLLHRGNGESNARGLSRSPREVVFQAGKRETMVTAVAALPLTAGGRKTGIAIAAKIAIIHFIALTSCVPELMRPARLLAIFGISVILCHVCTAKRRAKVTRPKGERLVFREN
jgi:hypothetical protein